MGKYNERISEKDNALLSHTLENMHIKDSGELIIRGRLEALIDILADKGLVDEEEVEERCKTILNQAFKKNK